MSKIPIAVSLRLPLYYEYISYMATQGSIWVSSYMIAKALGLTPSTVRQDIKYLGKIDSSYFGYSITRFKMVLEQALGICEGANLALVGVGRLGLALVHYKNFKEKGFIIKALFDKHQDLINTRINNIPVYPPGRIGEIIKKGKISIGIITTPLDAAQSIADLLIDAGIKGIWNFAPINLKTPPHITVENVNLCPSLFSLVYKIKMRKGLT